MSYEPASTLGQFLGYWQTLVGSVLAILAAAATVLVTVWSAVVQSRATRDAAKLQARATQEAVAVQIAALRADADLSAQKARIEEGRQQKHNLERIWNATRTSVLQLDKFLSNYPLRDSPDEFFASPQEVNVIRLALIRNLTPLDSVVAGFGGNIELRYRRLMQVCAEENYQLNQIKDQRRFFRLFQFESSKFLTMLEGRLGKIETTPPPAPPGSAAPALPTR